jgi:hypothetical protein
MGDADRHISTVDKTVRIEKRETQFVVPAFEEICTSCLTSNLCKKVDADQSMNPDNDPNLLRYKLCASHFIQVGDFKFEIGVDWPVKLEHETPPAGVGAANRNRQQQPPRRHVFMTDMSKKHHSINGHIRRVDDSQLEASIHCMMKLLNTTEERSQVKRTAKGHGGMFVLRPSTQIRAPFKVTLPEIFDSNKGWLHEGGELRIIYQLSMATEHDLTKAPCPKAETCVAMLAMLDAGNGDVILRVGEHHETIEAHACVLGARSPVFAATFNNGMRESETREALFEELDARAVNEMVRYMYGGEVPEDSLQNDEQTFYLMAAANHFQVESLVDRCTRVLRERFSVEKIAEYLKIADMMNCDSFKEACLKYTAEHMNEVEETEAYNDLVEARPALLREVVAQLTGSVHKRRRVDRGPG